MFWLSYLVLYSILDAPFYSGWVREEEAEKFPCRQYKLLLAFFESDTNWQGVWAHVKFKNRTCENYMSWEFTFIAWCRIFAQLPTKLHVKLGQATKPTVYYFLDWFDMISRMNLWGEEINQSKDSFLKNFYSILDLHIHFGLVFFITSRDTAFWATLICFGLISAYLKALLYILRVSLHFQLV